MLLDGKRDKKKGTNINFRYYYSNIKEQKEKIEFSSLTYEISVLPLNYFCCM